MQLDRTLQPFRSTAEGTISPNLDLRYFIMKLSYHLKLSNVVLLRPILTFSTPQGRASLPPPHTTGLYDICRCFEVYSWNII